MSLKARLYIAAVGVLGFALAANQLAHWQSQSLLRYGCYFLVGMFTAGLKVSLRSIRYPLGLKGEEIPIGARTLTAVDCLDALASDRHYRRALTLEKAMEQVTAESGKTFDPKIVELLKKRYIDSSRRPRRSRRRSNCLPI